MLDPTFLRDMEAANRFATELNQSSYFREMTEAAQVAHDLRTKQLLGMTDEFGKSMALLGDGLKPLLDQLDAIRATNPFIGGSALQTHIDQLHANFALPALISDRFSPIRDHFAAESKQIREFLSTFELSDGVTKLMAGYQTSLLRPTAWEAMTNGFDRLNDAYDDLLEDPVAMQLPVVADLRLPERDVRSHAAVVNAFGDDEDEDAVLPAFLLDAPDQTLRRLRAVSPRLADKFESAIRNLGSVDPQAASNACLAVRQILLGLLDTFAPRDVVKEWAKAHCPDALHKGTPTPAGRVMYLFRFELSENTSYSKFLLENCRSVRQLVDLINDVIHDESATGPRVAMPPHRVHRVLFRASSAFDEILFCVEVQKFARQRAN